MLRRTFLASTTAVMAFGSSTAYSAPTAQAGARDASTLALLTAAADKQAETVLAASGSTGVGGARGVLRQMRRLVTPFVWPQSRYFQDEALISPIQALLSRVEQAQHEDCTFSGGNSHSPPDSAFLI